MDEKQTNTYTLPSGVEIEIETIPEQHRGRVDVNKGKDEDKVPFEQVIQPLGEMSQLLFDTLTSSVKTPDSVTLEFGASIKGSSKLVIVSGEAQGNIKVQLTWKRPG
jgi:hypothetical protein